MEVSPDGSYLVITDGNGIVYLLDSMTGSQLMSVDLPNIYIKVARFSPDTSILGVGGNL